MLSATIHMFGSRDPASATALAISDHRPLAVTLHVVPRMDRNCGRTWPEGFGNGPYSRRWLCKQPDRTLSVPPQVVPRKSSPTTSPHRETERCLAFGSNFVPPHPVLVTGACYLNSLPHSALSRQQTQLPWPSRSLSRRLMEHQTTATKLSFAATRCPRARITSQKHRCSSTASGTSIMPQLLQTPRATLAPTRLHRTPRSSGQ